MLHLIEQALAFRTNICLDPLLFCPCRFYCRMHLRCGNIPFLTAELYHAVSYRRFIYKRHKTKKTALIACILASVVMGIAAALANYFILLPLFESFMPLDQLIASFAEFLPFIHTKLDVVLFNAFPFNLLKGLVIGGVTMLIYKRLTPILKGR